MCPFHSVDIHIYDAKAVMSKTSHLHLCMTLSNRMDCSMPGLAVQPGSWYSQSLFKLMSIESVMPSNHLILCSPLLLLPPIPPSIRVFSKESTHVH